MEVLEILLPSKSSPGGAQKRNPSVSHLGQCTITSQSVLQEPAQFLYGLCARVFFLWKPRSEGGSHADACWLSSQYWTGHSQRAQPDLGIWKHSQLPIYSWSFIVWRANSLADSRKHLRQEVWRQAELDVWVQTPPGPSCSFPAATKGSQRTMGTWPHFKKSTAGLK